MASAIITSINAASDPQATHFLTNVRIAPSTIYHRPKPLRNRARREPPAGKGKKS